MPADPMEPLETTADASGLRYGEALEELEALLDDLEDADIDVDHLAERVARGVQLVRFCRERLAIVTADVDQVVADLLVDEVAESGGDGESTTGSGSSEDSGGAGA